MKAHRNDLRSLSARQLLSRRRATAARLGDVQEVLAGTLTEQTRRCGKPGCRCAGGQPHGPYAFFAPKTAARGRLRYVPASLAGVVARYLRNGEEIERLLAEISAINAQLLAPREPSQPVSAAVLSGPARAEAVAVLASMTISALGGTRERRAQDHEQSPGEGGADLPAAILDGPGPGAHRVDQEPVRPGGHGGRARLGSRR